MAALCPSLAEILAKLCDDWCIPRNRFERYRIKQDVDDNEAENCDEAFYRHPFPGAVEWVATETGMKPDKLRLAATKHFHGYAKTVKALRSLDENGRTAELWAMLVRECPSVLRQAGLMQDKLPVSPPPPPVQVEGKDADNSTLKTPPPPPDPAAVRQAALKELEPADRKAYYTYSYAESKLGTTTDRQAYQWLSENGLPDERESPELSKELAGYKLPSPDTWSKQVRNARKKLSEQKHTRRAGRAAGSGSIVGSRELDKSEDAD